MDKRIIQVREAGDPYLQRVGRQQPKASLILSGAWLFSQGFTPGTKVIVLVDDDTIIIRKEVQDGMEV